MNSILKKLLFVVIGISLTTASQADQKFGDPNDPLVQTFAGAKGKAIQHLSKFKSCSLNSYTPQVKQWISVRQQSIIQDISTSTHNWYTDLQPTCAFTQTYFAAPINFSYSACKSILGNTEKAVEILIRESVFHQGITDEAEASNLTTAMMNADLNCDVNEIPENEFNPGICQGMKFNPMEIVGKITPGSASLSGVIKNVSFKKRYRVCNQLTGCYPWAITDLPGILSPYGVDFRIVKASPLLISSSLMFGIPGKLLYINQPDITKDDVGFGGNDYMLYTTIPSQISGTLYIKDLKTTPVITDHCVFWKNSLKSSVSDSGSWAEEDFVLNAKVGLKETF